MSNKNIFPALLTSFIVSFVCYNYFTKKDEIVENWWMNSGVPMTTNLEKVGPDGNAVPGNNQSNLTFDTNPLINTSFTDKKEIKDSCSPFMKNNKEEYCNDCNEDGPSNAGFYTVPGQYDSYLPPRMNSAGLNSYVRYQLPDEKYQANKANDPFTIANYLEKPKIKEGYRAPTGTEPTPIGGQRNLTSKEVKGLELPTQSDMTNTGAVSKDAKDGFYVNSERLIFSLQKKQNVSIILSLGATRSVLFMQPKTKTVLSFEIPNGMIYSFRQQINLNWMHGIPKEEQKTKRYSMAFWGYIPNFFPR